MSDPIRGKRRILGAMMFMAGGVSPSLAQAPIYKTPMPAGLMVERWRQTGDPDKFFEVTGDDLRHELWLASRENKNGLLVFFRSAENSYADLMRDTVLRNEEVHSYFKSRLRTIVLERLSERPLVDLAGTRTTEARVAAELGVTRAPAFVFFDLQGAKRYVHQRPIFDAGTLITFARCMADGIYERADVERNLRGG